MANQPSQTPARGNASAPAAAPGTAAVTNTGADTGNVGTETPAGEDDPAAAAAAAEVKSAGFVTNLDEILQSSKSRTSGGTKIRPNIGYTLHAESCKKLIGTAIPDQQKIIMQIMNRALTAEKPVISEPDLHALVVKAHAEGKLKTRQEPWHIFRYYRTALKSAGALKEVQIQGELQPAAVDQKKAA